jgi:hypothetical protein
MERRHHGVVIAFAAAASVSLVVSLSAAGGHTSARAALAVRLHGHAVRLSASSVPAGRTLIRVTTSGRGAHALMLAHLNPGVTVARFTRALATRDGLAALRLASFQGGIDALPSPGHRWQMVTDLRPGTYAVVDHAENGGRPNFARGAIAALHVTATDGTPAAQPRAAGSIAMVDFAFRIRLPQTFHGHGWVRFENRGNAIHRIILLRLDPGVSFEQADAAIRAHDDDNPQERPPGQPIELIGAVSPGFVGYLRVDLPPGRYVAACFEADRQTDLVPHTELGMIGHFTIG